MDDKLAALGGTVVGVTIGLVFVVVLPMLGNHNECGRLTLCPSEIEQGAYDRCLSWFPQGQVTPRDKQNCREIARALTGDKSHD